MVFREEDITKFINGRQFFILTAVLFVVLTWIAPKEVTSLQGASMGVCFQSVSTLVLPQLLSFLLSTAGMIGVGFLLAFLNKTYSYVREVTYVFSSTFLWLGIANPMIATHFYDGTILSIAVMLLALILFSTYQDGRQQRRVYITFAILSVCCMFQYSFFYLIIVMIFGFMQMRAMGIRSFLAIIFGLITPYWIACGTGLIEWSQFKMPNLVSAWSSHAVEQSWSTISIIYISIVLALTLFGMNVLQLISYKLQTRSYNGFFIALMLLTMIMMAIDYNNLLVYLPVLNICIAVQMAHAFTIRKHTRRYIPYLLFIALCVGLYAWQVFY